jgi:hypothetical protein
MSRDSGSYESSPLTNMPVDTFVSGEGSNLVDSMLAGSHKSDFSVPCADSLLDSISLPFMQKLP